MCVQQRTQSCVRTAGGIVSTALGIIKSWEGMLHRVLISVLLYSDHVGSGIINHPLRDEPGLKAKKIFQIINEHTQVSEGSMGVNDTLGSALLVLMARCKTRKTFTSTTGPYRRVQQSCHTRSRQGSWGNVCVTRCVCVYSREPSRVYVQQETSYLQQ